MIIGQNDKALEIMSKPLMVLFTKFARKLHSHDGKERDEACMPGKGGLCVACGTGDCLRRVS